MLLRVLLDKLQNSSTATAGMYDPNLYSGPTSDLRNPDFWNSPTPELTLSPEEIAEIREWMKDEAFVSVIKQMCALLSTK